MSFLLSNFLGGSSTTGDSSYSDENKQLIIEKLTTKMTNSAHLEDRKAAAQTIKSLARSHRLEIGTLALQALVNELSRDLEDEELAKIILETLDILCSTSLNENDEKINGIEVQFCEILLKDDRNVALLLDLIGNSEDFYVRFTSIQILISLCNSQPFQLQSAVLNSPSGVEKVLNLLKDSREIVRNEGLLLCEVLVRGNSDLQKILAFQGAFEEIMKIIVEEEGPWIGPLIIQDAFNIISAMLNLNTSNQNYFRDSICFKQLAGLLSLPQEEDFGLWNSTRISNYLAALNILDKILCKENVDLEASQNAAMRTHFQGPLLILAFTPKIPLKVSASALNCLTGLIWSNNRAQQIFANEKLSKIPISNCLMKIEAPISPLMAAIILAVHGNVSEEGVEQRIKALELVEAFCFGNYEGQLVLLSTLKASGTASPGTVILDALFDLDSSRKRDPWHCWYASILLCHLIDGNDDAKKVLLNHRFIDPEDENEGEDLLTCLMLNMIRIATDSRGSTCQKSIIGYLQLLVVWFHESSSSIKSFLSESSFLQYLIERITQQPHELEIQGFSAVILGICVLFNDDSIERVGSEALKGIIKNRIGPDLFVSRLSRLKSHTDKNELICELVKGILLKNYESFMNLVVRPTPVGTKASHTATLAQLTKDLVESRALLASCQAHLSETSTLADKLKIGITERDAYILQLQKFISEKNQKIAQMAHEMSSHYEQQEQQQMTSSYENCLSDQAALKSLKETIKSFQETVARQQARIEELEALLRDTEEKDSELEKWKVAYHKLYDQVQQQLNFVNVSESVSDHTDSPKETSADSSKETSADSEKKPMIIENGDRTFNTTDSCLNNIEILSPSLFMSPLAESEIILSESVAVETVENNNENSLSPELVSVNQIPLPEKMNEYPNLNEDVDTSFTAAVIVSEEFANNEPNPSADEIVENISSECPPDNFLASDPDENIEIVSSEEIKNVLRFFDDLSGDSVEEEDSVVEIKEEFDQMHITNEFKSQDQQVPDVIDDKINDSFELPADINDDEFDYYAESNFNNIPNVAVEEEHEDHLGYANESIVEGYDHIHDRAQGANVAIEEEHEDHLGYANESIVEGYDHIHDQAQGDKYSLESAEISNTSNEHVYTEESLKYPEGNDQTLIQQQQPDHSKDFIENLETFVNTEEPQKQEYTEDLFTQQEHNGQEQEYAGEPEEYQYTEDQSSQEYQYSEEPYNYDKQQENVTSESYSHNQQEYSTEEPYYYDQQPQYSEETYFYGQHPENAGEPFNFQQQEQSTDNSDQQQEYSTNESYSNDPQNEYSTGDSYNYDQQHEYSTEEQPCEQIQEPIASIDDYFSQEASQDFLQDYTDNQGQYAENASMYADGQDYSVDSYNQDQVISYNQENYAEGYISENYNEQVVEPQYTGDVQGGQELTLTAEGQDYNNDTQEYVTEGQDNSGNQEYFENYNQNQEVGVEEVVQERNVEEQQEYRTVGQDYTTSTHEYNATDQGYNSNQEYYSTEGYDYSTNNQDFGANDQDYNAEGYPQTQEYNTEGYTGQYQDTESYVQSQEYVADTQEFDDYTNSGYSTEATDYSQYTNEQYDNQEQYQEAQNTQESSEYYYYDEATGYTYGFDQNVNQYYYYDPNTCEYVYYTAPETETVESNTLNVDDESITSSNPSLFDTAGPPMVPLQQSTTPQVESQLQQSFVAAPVYNL